MRAPLKNNSANGGGAISVSYIEQNYDTEIVIANSVFTDNNANFWCGALTISARRNEYLLRTWPNCTSTFK